MIDTNILVYALRGDPGVEAAVREWRVLVVPAVIESELWYGVLNSKRPAVEEARLNGFLELCTVAPVDSGIARKAAEVRYAVRRLGRPIPANDLLVAATALVLDLPLLTRDGHFDLVDGLRIVSP